MIQAYYDDGLTSYQRQIGKLKLNKINLFRKGKKFFKWYFNDKFGLTINILSIVWMVI